jgi:hypothetical protein
MKTPSLFIVGLFFAFSQLAHATQADDTIITVVAKTPGVTPFISQFTLQAADTSTLDSVRFTIAAKPGSVTRLFSQVYSASYLASHGYLQAATGLIFLPVYGLYSNYTNSVTLTYTFLDGSSKQDTESFVTGAFSDPCGISNPTVLQPRNTSKALSYDYMLVRGACGGASGVSPLILDTDGEVRWSSPFPRQGVLTASSAFFDHAVWVTDGGILYRIDLDGTITQIKDYSSLGVVHFHHQMDPGRTGIVLEADTTDYEESLDIEVDTAGNVIKTWNMADIISHVMLAGGDDPSQFVYPSPTDWWHNNSTTYRLSDNSQIISSRENFVVALDYDSDAVKWILGDTTKKWHQFPSLAQFSLDLGPDTLPPIGQHSVSITFDDDLLLMDNGRNSQFQMPLGINRGYSSPRKYALDLSVNLATEVWNYPRGESIYAQFCGSIYEDAPLNYLIDYSYITGQVANNTAQLLGLDAAGAIVFDYQYPTAACDTAYNSAPLHAEQLILSDVGQTLNISTRGSVMTGQNALIAGFIITGYDAKEVILRALGPSLDTAGVTGTLANPVLTLYNSSGVVVASNDDWGNSPNAGAIEGQGLAPTNAAESAILTKLAPGTYTVVVTGKDDSTGIGLVEAYDLSRNSNSSLGNVSTRGFVGDSDDVLISGFIIGNRNDETVITRAIGPSLATTGIKAALGDPTITLYNTDGAVIASNDNWQDDPGAETIQAHGLAPTDPAEAATLITLSPGSYTAVVRGAKSSTGVGLVEVYNLP